MRTNRIMRWITVGTVTIGVIASIATLTTDASAKPPLRRQMSAGASWSEIDRKPNLNTNSPAGFYIWRDRDYVYVVANDRNRSRPSHFAGTVTVQGGSVSNLSGYETEGRDRFSKLSSNRVSFNLETGNGLDGVRFEVNGGKRIVLNLRSNDQGIEQVYLGQYKIRTVRSPLVIAK
jgi:hypothetical protein